MDINNLTPEDLNVLEDMFGKDSPALAEQIRNSRAKALDVLGKPAAQEIVDAASVPGKTAAQAAETLAPKQLPVPVEGPQISNRMLGGLNKAASAAEGAVGPGVIESPIGGLPSTQVSSGLPAAAGEEAIETTGRVLGEAGADAASVASKAAPSMLGRLGALASKAALPLTAAYEFLHPTSTANPTEITPTPVPGRSDVMAQGPDLVPIKKSPAAPTTDNGPSLFDRVSAKYKEHTPEMTSPAPTAEEPSSLDALKSLMKPGAIDSSLAAAAGFGDDKALDRALQARDKSTFVNQILKGLELASSGISGTVKGGTVTKPVAQEAFDQNIKLADRPVQDVLLKQDQKKKGLDFQRTMEDFKDSQLRRDPSSMVSVQVREALKSAFPQMKIPDTMSAEQAKDMGFNLSTVLKSMEMSHAKGLANEEKTKQVNNKWIESAGKQAIKMDQGFQNARRLKGLIDDMKAHPERSNATDQITLLFKYIKGLDDSVVRPSEVKLFNEAGGILGRMQTYLSQWGNKPQAVPKRVLQDILDRGEKFYEIADQEQKAYKQILINQAKNHGIPEEQYDSFIPGYTASKTSSKYPVGSIVKDKKSGKTYKVREDGKFEAIK